MTDLIKSEKIARVVETVTDLDTDVDSLETTVAAIPRTLIHSADVTTPSTQSLTSGTPAEITGLSVTLTPQSATSKFVLMANWNGELSTAYNHECVFGFKRGSDYIGNPTGTTGSRNIGRGIISQGYYSSDTVSTPDSWSGQYVDTPNTTDEIVYKVFITTGRTGGQTLYNNRSATDGDSLGYERLTSSLIILEIA